MSHRYRLYPAPAQAPGLDRHCADARFVWNLALEQTNCWQPSRGPTPGPAERQRQLAEARKGTWLAEGSSSVHQQALRDFDRAMANWWGKTHRRPRWRTKGIDEGFCVRDVSVKRLNRRWATVGVPKVGMVRFRLSRALPVTFGMARVTLDAAGRWHVSFSAAQAPLVRTAGGSAVGIDRGVATTLALSDGTMFRAPSSPKLEAKVGLLDQQLARRRRGSKRRAKTKLARARTHGRIADRRRDWVEKTTTRLVLDHDVLVLEDLRVEHMVRHPKPKADPDRPGAFLTVRCGGQSRAQPLDPSGELGCLRPTSRGQGRRQWRHRPSRRSSIHLPAVPALWSHRPGEPREPSGLPVHQLWPYQSRRHERCGEHRGPGARPRAHPGTRGRTGQPVCSRQSASSGSENLWRGRGVMSRPPQESPGFSPGEDVKPSAVPVATAPPGRGDLKELLFEVGIEHLIEVGLAGGTERLTFKRAFDRAGDERFVRVSNASIVGRNWADLMTVAGRGVVAVEVIRVACVSHIDTLTRARQGDNNMGLRGLSVWRLSKE